MVVVKKSPVFLWPALSKWQDRTYLGSKLPRKLRVHLPSEPVVRIHHTDMPFEHSANWTRPFVEEFVSPQDLLKGDLLVYSMFHNLKQIPTELQKDIDVRYFTKPWRGAMEVNLW